MEAWPSGETVTLIRDINFSTCIHKYHIFHISITSLANILHCSSFPIAHEIHKYIYHSMDRCHLMQRSIQNTPQDRMTR